MQGITFTFAGKKGKAFPYQGGAFISWGGMGFHLQAAKPPLRDAILKALTKD